MINKNKVFLKYSLALLFSFFLISSCAKKTSDNSGKNGKNKIENPSPRKLNALNIGTSSPFAVLAYANITSIPNSSINGKVGLMPGTREQLTLDPSEVVGGALDIMTGDDDTTSTNLLSYAKLDMVSAYKEAVQLIPDSDKIGLFEGKLGGNILPAGCYMWNGDLSLVSDLTLDGSESDVWIFKIPANMNVASGVHLNLSGGAQAKNIFWQVAGAVILESESEMSGTVIAQQFVEMKNHAKLTGRAFAKNGYVKMSRAIIINP